MKIIRSETYLRPLPEIWTREGSRITILPILDQADVPDDEKFLFRARSYVVGVFSGSKSWFSIKFDLTGLPLVFNIPAEFTDSTPNYRVFAGYNDGFLGGSFSTGFYSLKEKVQYWYTIAKTSEKFNFNDYFLTGPHRDNSPVVIDLSSKLNRPLAQKWVYYRIGDPITIGQYGVIIGRKHEPWDHFQIGVTNLVIGEPSLSLGAIAPEEQNANG